MRVAKTLERCWAAPLVTALSVAAIAVVSMTGCGSGKESEPTTGTYTLSFPSVEAAIDTDFVKLQVFNAAGTTAFCQTLVELRLTAQSLPSPLFDAPPTKLCAMFQGQASANFTLPLPYGQNAILAVASRNQADFLIGCIQVTSGQADFDAPIALSLVGGTVLPPVTQCTSLAEHCSGGC